MIERIWLNPPLAFARVGGSSQPCDAFNWGPDDVSVGGTGRTTLTLAGTDTLSVDAHGQVTVRSTTDPSNQTVAIKDQDGFRPVCPFFELLGEWSGQDTKGEQRQGSGQITQELLEAFGMSLDDLSWTIRMANRKAWRYTGEEGDIIECTVELKGSETRRQALQGRSRQPSVGKVRLVPLGPDSDPPFISLGWVQLTASTPTWPGLRLRFTAPPGLVYAPKNIADRLKALEASSKGSPTPLDQALDDAKKAHPAVSEVLDMFAGDLRHANTIWQGFDLGKVRAILDPDSEWAKFAWPKVAPLTVANLPERIANFLAQYGTVQEGVDKLRGLAGKGDNSQLLRHLIERVADAGCLPVAVFGFAVEPGKLLSSLGLIDDISDGVIDVVLRRPHREVCKAHARVVMAPPNLAPDRRMPVSVADGLIDRVQRHDARALSWVSGANEAQADAEVHELMCRAFETVGLQNVDAVADFIRMENEHLAIYRGDNPSTARGLVWDAAQDTLQNLPLTAIARQTHSRLAVVQIFEAFVRENPTWYLRIRPADVRPMSINAPDPTPYYGKHMPGLMRGGDRRPLHLTRRQINLLKAWTQRVTGIAPP